jgi:hypothetical protein
MPDGRAQNGHENEQTKMEAPKDDVAQEHL